MYSYGTQGTTLVPCMLVDVVVTYFQFQQQAYYTVVICYNMIQFDIVKLLHQVKCFL